MKQPGTHRTVHQFGTLTALLTALTTILTVPLAAGGCGSSSASSASGAPDGSSSDDAATTPTCAAAPFADHGPFVSGVTTLEVEVDGAKVKTEVWYPADPASATGKKKDTYDMRAWLPKDSAAKIPDAESPLHEMDAYRDLATSIVGKTRRFPVVLFSHGLGGYRMQTSFLMTHLASWGYVVVAPDHDERGLAIVLGGDTSKIDTTKAAPQMRAALARMKSEDAAAGGRFEKALDFSHVGAIGHSMGGATVAEIFGDDDVRVGILLASPGFGDMPPKPLMLMWGTADGVAKPSAVQQSYDKQPAGTKRGISLRDGGHMAFTDLCAIGQDKGGVLQIAISHGLEVSPLVAQLATDGCGLQKGGAPFLDVAKGWKVIDHFVTAELRAALGSPAGEKLAVGLDDAASKCFGDTVASLQQ